MRRSGNWKTALVAVIGLALLASGCFPLELSVSDAGEIAIPRAEGVLVFNTASGIGKLVVPGSDREAPAFAVLSKDGTRLLRAALTLDDDGDAGSLSRVLMTNLKDGSTEELFEASNCSFLQLDPRGRFVSYAFISGESYEGVQESLPEIKILNLSDRSERRISRNSSSIHRWMPDGSAVLFLKTDAKDTNGRVGALCIFDVATGKTRRIAGVLDAEGFDLSPDGKEVILSAKGVSAPDVKASAYSEDEKYLYVINVSDGSSRRLGFDAEFCRYSPDGKIIAYLSRNALHVAPRDFSSEPRRVARTVTSIDNSTKFHLTWISNDEVLVLRKKNIIGTVAATYELLAVNVASGEARPLQEKIEASIRENLSGSR